MSFLFDMESSTGQSLTGQSNVTGIIDSGISVNLLLLGENLVEKAFEEALEVVREYNHSEVLSNTSKQLRDSEVNKSINEPGLNMDNFNVAQTEEQRKEAT